MKTSHYFIRLPAFTCSSLLALACQDPIKPAERIDEPRVLGVRVSTEQGEATLVPGQRAQVELLLASPEGPQPARVAYRFCEAANSARGVPFCVASPWAEGTVDASRGKFAVDVPASVGAGTRQALLGVACTRGEPSLAEDPLGDACSGDAAPLRFSFDAWTLAAEPVLNPDLEGLSVNIGGESAPLSDAAEPPRCDDATPVLGAGREQTLDVDLGSALPAQKTLQISHFSTRGELARHYSFVTPGQEPRVTLSWQAPIEAGPVKQYLVVRDGAGGVSWATWNLCVR